MVVGLNHPEPINGRQLEAYEHSEAGLLSGIATRALIQPLDVLKIRFQLQEEPMRGSGRGKYGGVFQAISTIIREEGATAFWKGHVPAQALSAAYGLVQFTTYQVFLHRLKEIKQLDEYEHSVDFVCGSLAGVAAMTAAMPMDVIRTRLVAQSEQPKLYRGMLHAFCKIYRIEGVAGLFRGIVPSLAQVAPFTGLQFAVYNLLSDTWNSYFHKHDSFGALLCGAMAGTAAKTVLYPLDLIRHRIQVMNIADARKGFGKTTHDKGIWRTIMGVVKRESVTGLFKGLCPSMIKAGANSGFSFLFYELAVDLIRSK